MKILSTNQYIKEKMKIVPISNDEFEKIGDFDVDRMKYVMRKINNPKYEDILVPGNIVLIETDELKYHGIALNKTVSRKIFGVDDYEVMCTFDFYGRKEYLISKTFKENFPENIQTSEKIIDVFETNIDMDDIAIKSYPELIDELKKIFENYKLKRNPT